MELAAGGRPDAECRSVAALLRLDVKAMDDAVVIDQNQIESAAAKFEIVPSQWLAPSDVVLGELDARRAGPERAQANQVERVDIPSP